MWVLQVVDGLQGYHRCGWYHRAMGLPEDLSLAGCFGILPSEDAAEMERIIEEEFGQVNRPESK